MGHWVNEKAEREFLALYDTLAAEAFVELGEPQTLDVDTSFGTTRVYHWPGSGDPLVMLPGAGTNALMWAPLIAELPGRDIYAVDPIGDPGRSVQRVPLHNRDDVAMWVGSLLDGLHLDRCTLIGASYGGWSAFTFAQVAPTRVDALVLLEPVLDKLRPWFWFHGLASGLALLLPGPLRRAAAKPLHMEAVASADKRLRRFGLLGQMKFRRGAPRPPLPVPDTDLSSLKPRALVLLGRWSQVHHAKRLAARLRRDAPGVETEIVPHAGHALPFDQAKPAGARIARFLDDQ